MMDGLSSVLYFPRDHHIQEQILLYSSNLEVFKKKSKMLDGEKEWDLHVNFLS